jgi:undecaprenyl-diphosphatase
MSDSAESLTEAATVTDRHIVFARAILRWMVIFIGVSVFVPIALELRQTSVVWFDAPMQRVLSSMRAYWLTSYMKWVTLFGKGEVLASIAIIVSFFLWWRRHPHSAAYLAISAGGGELMNAGLKLFFGRERPDISLRLISTEGLSFPSGHSMVSAAIYGAIAFIAASRFPKARWPVIIACVVLVGSIGFSRAYLYVHYPSDVLAGWGLGVTWPLWLKPLLLGRGFTPKHVSAEELAADGVQPNSGAGIVAASRDS